MNVFNLPASSQLLSELKQSLANFRQIRQFQAQDVLDAKVELIHAYFQKTKLRAAVIGLSGGIDSAVCLGLLVAASKKANSQLQTILPVFLPYAGEKAYASEEGNARQYAQSICQTFNLPLYEIPLAPTLDRLKQTVDQTLKQTGTQWAGGQLVAYLRTPTLYYLTSLLSDRQLPGLVVGTTNRDEGAYLGYVGKASDGMVDLQLISDLHKSEVYQLGQILQIPESVLQQSPTGNMYDGRHDEDVFGTTYDFVELYLSYLSLPPFEQTQLKENWSDAAHQQFAENQSKLENLHQYNAHKYLVGSPAIHLDVLPSGVPGGWKDPKPPQTLGNLTAYFPAPPLPQTAVPAKAVHQDSAHNTKPTQPIHLSDILTPQEIDQMLQAAEPVWEPVGLDGIKAHYQTGDPIGSWRATTFSQAWADCLWQRIKPRIPPFIHSGYQFTTDLEDCPIWRVIGVSPLLRLIRYKTQGALVAHYDAPFTYNSQFRTLQSLVICLQKPESGGATRFITDPQSQIPLNQRNLSDWTRRVKPQEVSHQYALKAGEAIVFPHRLLHDSEPVGEGKHKVIIRTDLTYLRCSP